MRRLVPFYGVAYKNQAAISLDWPKIAKSYIVGIFTAVHTFQLISETEDSVTDKESQHVNRVPKTSVSMFITIHPKISIQQSQKTIL